MPNSDDTGAMLVFDTERLERLRGAWKQAVTLKQDQFKFESHVMVTDYAKYMIQHLDNQFAGSA